MLFHGVGSAVCVSRRNLRREWEVVVYVVERMACSTSAFEKRFTWTFTLPKYLGTVLAVLRAVVSTTLCCILPHSIASP